MNEQIDMVTELLTDFDEMGFAPTTLCPDPEAYAIEWRKKLTEELKGYRKASEVAREIFEEIEKIIQKKKKAISMFKDGEDDFYDGEIHALEVFGHLLAELKKKYTESEDTE